MVADRRLVVGPVTVVVLCRCGATLTVIAGGLPLHTRDLDGRLCPSLWPGGGR